MNQRKAGEAVTGHPIESLGSAHPQRAAPILVKRPNVIAREAVARRVDGEAAVAEAVQPGVGADPEASVAALGDGTHHRVRQTGTGVVGGEDAVLVAGEAAAVRADPERALFVDEEGPHVVLFDRTGGGIEQREAHAVEPEQPVQRGNPDIAVGRLRQRVGALREAALSSPSLVDVLGDGLVRVERQSRPWSTDHKGKCEQRADRAKQERRPRSWLHYVRFLGRSYRSACGHQLVDEQIGRARILPAQNDRRHLTAAVGLGGGERPRTSVCADGTALTSLRRSPSPPAAAAADRRRPGAGSRRN